jgi:hypothetical protein
MHEMIIIGGDLNLTMHRGELWGLAERADDWKIYLQINLIPWVWWMWSP